MPGAKNNRVVGGGHRSCSALILRRARQRPSRRLGAAHASRRALRALLSMRPNEFDIKRVKAITPLFGGVRCRCAGPRRGRASTNCWLENLDLAVAAITRGL